MKYRPLIRNHGKMFTLETDDLGGLYLEVVCGGIAMFPVRIKLDEEEAEKHRQLGMPYLEKLACSISRTWPSFKPRAIT